MTPIEALDLLNRVTSAFSGTRSDHVQIQSALQVLETYLKANGEEPKSSPEEPEAATGSTE